jgi:hypothetical protein
VHGFIINTIIGAAVSIGSGTLVPNTSSEADASGLSDLQRITSSSTRIENLDQYELPITDPLMGLSQDMTSRSTADASVGDRQPTSLSPVSSCQQEDPQRQQTQEQDQVVESSMDNLPIASEAQRRVERHSIPPVASSQMDEPGASQPEQIPQQQKEQQLLQQLLQGQEMDGASQQQPQQQARPMVVWNGIMEMSELVRFICALQISAVYDDFMYTLEIVVTLLRFMGYS